MKKIQLLKRFFKKTVVPKLDCVAVDSSVIDESNVTEELICNENFNNEDISEDINQQSLNSSTKSTSDDSLIVPVNVISESQQQSAPQLQQKQNDPSLTIDITDISESNNTEQQTIMTNSTAFAIDADEWIIIGASVIGNGHISAKLPCQDNHKYEYLGNGWGLAITSDGAGSAEKSHVGSKLVTDCCIIRFKSLIKREGWIIKKDLPTDVEWYRHSYLALKTVRDDLDNFSQKNNISLELMNATVIVVIHTPHGILAVHIGDGRAGYKSEKGEWKSILTPHKGEEANQTIFLTSKFWENYPYVMSSVSVPEAVVVREKPYSFTLMSDGCERSAWQYYQKDEQTGIFYDPNIPHPPFFNPLCETLQSFRIDKVDYIERQEKWRKFITNGTKSFEREKDDKTMILGVMCK